MSTALEEWVEKGKAPSSFVASKVNDQGAIERTRLLSLPEGGKVSWSTRREECRKFRLFAKIEGRQRLFSADASRWQPTSCWPTLSERQDCPLSSMPQHHFAISRHVSIVLIQIVRKSMVPGPIRHKIKIIRRGGMHCRLQRSLSRIRNRPRWQPGALVGVVERVCQQVFVVQRAPVSSLFEFSVDHAGVGLQRDILGQPVVIYAGHCWPFFRNGGFFSTIEAIVTVF